MTAPAGLQSELAFETLLAALRSGDLRSSQFLAMPALVEVTGFPLAPTREAVKRAEEQGLVRILPKRGVMVMESGPQITRHCMDMRAALEREAVRRLIGRGETPALAGLRATHEALLAEAKNNSIDPDLPRRALQTDLSLHDFMASGLDNPFLAQAYQANRNRISIIQNVRSFLPDRVIPAMTEHLAIIAALERGDVEGATREIDRHLHLTLRWWGVASV